MKNICKSDYEKLKRQFNIKMGNETFPLAIAFWAVMGIMLGAFLMIISTEKGYTISNKIIPIYFPILVSSISYKGIKHDLELFMGLGYKRKRYFINEKVIQNIMFLMIAFFMSTWIIIMKKNENFWYLGFLFKSGFIDLLKSIIVNYLFITVISISYLLISLIINTLGEILFKKNSEKIIPIFLIFVLPVLLTTSEVFISNYNMRILTYISPIIILIEMYFEYKIIKNMDV
ncbi:hypothetical protein [Clostridium cochlearium]|uniref:ABC-2 family transporter protein n=1 Tax=Clostridium cochlearium TaxID=1494 RepID=A0A7Y3Y0F9_CLOCO|nr:hypothetical protein [Clostridium cochlearium]NMA57838.1 hypothetical protein [Clostridium cochlearium]NOH17257.1 hypothetical protein [Clostridium cochlearium]